MQKVTNFLEQNVQWVAITLGALFALWMAWGYIVNSPAKVEVDGQVYTPGELSKHTAETVASDLSSKIVNNTTITMKVPRPADRFMEAMAWKGTTDQPLPLVSGSLPESVWKAPSKTDPNAPPGSQQQTDPKTGQPVVANGMATVVLVPTPTPDEARVGRSSVVVPPPPPPLADPSNPNAAPPPPVAPPVDPVTGQPPTVDKEWVTQSFKIDMNQLLDAFKKANIPPGQIHQTAFLHVEIVRQELDGNKNPIGEPQPIKPLEVTTNGQAVPPYPGDDPSLRQPQAAYEAWAIQNTQHILQPMFYQVVKGDQWLPPGMEAAQQQVQWTLDNPPPGWQNDPAWRDAVMKHRQIQAKERTAQKRQAAPRAPAGGGAGRRGGGEREGGAPGFAPRDTARPAVPPRAGGGFENEGMAPGSFPGSEGGYVPNIPNMPQPGTAYPNGLFDPAAWKQTSQVSQIQAWGHDVNVVPGKTYQYKMRYRIKNPLYNVGGNVAKNQKDTQVFACISEWSTPSKPVTVPEKTNFFVARGLVAGSSRVQFEVFKWEEGQQHSQIFDVQPGDVLGAPMNVGTPPTEIDFSTGWYLVGVSGENVLLSDKEGNVKIRNRKNDESDALYKQLKDLVAATKALQQQQNPTGVPGVPGVAPGGGIPLPGGK